MCGVYSWNSVAVPGSDLDERSRWVGIDGFIENITGGIVGLMASCIVLFTTTLR